MKAISHPISPRHQSLALAAAMLTLGSGALPAAELDLSKAATMTGSPAASAAVNGDYNAAIDYDADGNVDSADLQRASQNPVADLISLPFQNNTNFNVGPGSDEQNILNIQPVIPIHLNDDWNVINRFIAPLIWQPEFVPNTGSEFGLGDLQYTAFFSPSKASDLIWGLGPVFQFPTATDDVLGTEKWSVGPSLVVLTMPGKWVIGGITQNVWSVAGDSARQDVNAMLTQPFINYNMADGWYLTSAPIITANWENSERWTVPLGAGIGRIFKIGKQPVNVSLSGYGNVVTPANGADWSVRFQFTLLFPKGPKGNVAPPVPDPGKWK